jgi:hypothetical protein
VLNGKACKLEQKFHKGGDGVILLSLSPDPRIVPAKLSMASWYLKNERREEREKEGEQEGDGTTLKR